MVAKSASEVRNGSLNPVTAPMFPSPGSSDLPRDEAVAREASYGWRGPSDRPAIERRKPSNAVGEEGEFVAESSSAGAMPRGVPVSAPDTRAVGQSMQGPQQSNGNRSQRSRNQIPECRPHQNEVDISPTDTSEARLETWLAALFTPHSASIACRMNSINCTACPSSYCGNWQLFGSWLVLDVYVLS